VYKVWQLITACKQYCLAAGATQGNIAYTQNVVCLESSDKRNFAWWMSAENYMEAQKWDWPSAQGCQEYCANRFMLHLGKLFCGER
jgi:hypothetical protein